MDRIARILMLGWSAEQIEEMEGELCLIPDLQISIIRLPSEFGLAAVLRSQLQLQRPDFFLYMAGGDVEQELKELAEVPGPVRPSSAILITGEPLEDFHLIRLAMHAGFRDFLSKEEVHIRLANLFRALIKERRATLEVKNRIVAFISPKGGSGCSTVAASVGHALQTGLNQKTLLLDLDYQFGTQYLFHDIEPSKGLKEALEQVDSLDAMALRAYLYTTSGGVDVLGVTPSQMLISGEIEPERLIRLLDLLNGQYDNVIIDMPNQIDALFGAIIERVTSAVLVVRQDLASVRHGAKLIDILEKELDLPRNVISLVVNAHDPEKTITVGEIEHLLGLHLIGVIPFDSESLPMSNDLGVPVGLHAPASEAYRNMTRIAEAAVGHESVDPNGGNVVVRFLRGLGASR
jgi:pilus assembly protein CpaE